MSKQITVEDMNTFISALQYSQTLVNTANSGADLAFDFLRSYDYYGSVRMAVSPDTKLTAYSIELKGYKSEDFFQYDASKFSGFFYKTGEPMFGSVSIAPIGELDDQSFVTQEALESLSIMKNESIHANYLSYDSSVSFDPNTDDSNTIFPISVYDTMFYKIGDTIPINDASWNVKLSLPIGSIRKAPDSNTFEMENVVIDGRISSKNIIFSSHLESKEEILTNVIGEDGQISSNAVVPENVLDGTNIFTLSKLKKNKFRTVGDSIELHLKETYTDEELKEKIDTYIESSGASTIYGGEDAFITFEQANMLAEYIFRKITCIQKAGVQL